MSEKNKTIIRQYFAHWGSPKAEMEALAPDFMAHMPNVPVPLNREAFIQYQGAVLSAFPDFAPTLQDQVAEGDLVANRLLFHGTHQGTFQGVAATGKQVAVTATTIERVVEGKIVEHWLEFDALGMMQQLTQEA